MLANCYIKLFDISSAISCYKKSLLIENNQSNIKTMEMLLFAKGLINLEDGKVDKTLLRQIKNEMDKTHYYYLK
jgi:hypothetical protein